MAVTTIYRVPDDGRKGRPKHVELLTPNKEHKRVASRWHLHDQINIDIYEGGWVRQNIYTRQCLLGGRAHAHYLQVSIVSCICFLFIVVNCKLVYDLKMAKHGRNMSSSSNQ